MDAGWVVSECLYKDDRCEVWHGDSCNVIDVSHVMGSRVADLFLVDAPYSEKTHKGHASGKVTSDRAASFASGNENATRKRAAVVRYARRKGSGRRALDYCAWSQADVRSLVDEWVPFVSGWHVSITDHLLAPAWIEEFERTKLLAFPPLPLVESGSRVRMMGDGPSNWTCWIVVARPRTSVFAKWGTLPGAYVQPSERDFNSKDGSSRIVGGKPLLSMQALVRDYSKRGDIVVDPCCGGGTTLVAAAAQGRYAIGIEKDRGRAELSAKRLSGTREQMTIEGYE